MESQQKYEIVQQSRELTPAVWSMIKGGIAPTLARAHSMSTEKMAATLLKGYELGLSFTASLEFVQVVQGKTSLSPRGALALMQTSPVIKFVKITRLVDGKNAFIGYECTIERMTGFTYTARWTIDQARAAGLIKAGGAWEAYPENMCMWRAVGFAADVAASDVTAGLTSLLKMPEQFGVGISDTGDIIDGTWAVQPEPVRDVAGELTRITEAFGAEKVLEHNNNFLPTTLEEIDRIEMEINNERA